MDTQHTAGNWVAFDDDFDGWCVKCEESPSGIGVAFIAKEIQQGKDHGEADAKLIAAAPELLNALEIARRLLQLKHDTSNQQDIFVLKTVQEAIKKVTS